MLTIEITKRTAQAAGCLLAVCCLSAGCAGTGSTGGLADAVAYPDWVLVVPAATDDASYFVGGCAEAYCESDGIEKARADALEQAAVQLTIRFTQLFDRALTETRVEATSTERYRFKIDGMEICAGTLGTVAELADSYVRPCPGVAPGGPVCDVFVLVSIENRAEDTALAAALDEFRRALRSEGSTGLAEVAERMQRLVTEPEPSE